MGLKPRLHLGKSLAMVFILSSYSYSYFFIFIINIKTIMILFILIHIFSLEIQPIKISKFIIPHLSFSL